MIKSVIKRDGTTETFDLSKIVSAIRRAFPGNLDLYPDRVIEAAVTRYLPAGSDTGVERIQDCVERCLHDIFPYEVAKSYMLYRDKHKIIRDFAKSRQDFISKYAASNNTANASIDDNSNVANKNIAVLNSELYKDKNIEVNRYRVMEKLKELYPDFNYKSYLKDLEQHIIYKNDENSTFGFPYCTSITMYPFLTDGIKSIGGLSAAPKNLDSFCGMFVNLVFAISTQFAGAVATSEFLLYFDYFARKEWGDDYYKKEEVVISNEHSKRIKTIKTQIEQYFQQIVYSINQPAAARGYQSVFWNVSIFDKPFFDGMFENFVFPDTTKPRWESLQWLQKFFMRWFNAERLKCVLTFPVVSYSLLYTDGDFQDKEAADFVAEELSEGDSFFIYISNSVDSLSSCCRLKNKLQTKEFNFTNGNIGVETGSKSVITLNINRIVQNCCAENNIDGTDFQDPGTRVSCADILKRYLINILERVYKYHTAYNELLWDLYNANLLPAYKAGFIDLNRQYLTVGISGLTASADFLGINVSDNLEYATYCQFIFSIIKEQNIAHKTKKTTYNTELIPAESAGAKLYKWDLEDGYYVPEDINLYTSYIFKPYDNNTTVLDKLKMHGEHYIGDFLDGGAACHINLDSHPDKEQCKKLLYHAAEVGCQYWTINVPNCECDECGFIAKQPFVKCPKCNSTKVSLWDRIIGYLTKISNWSEARQLEQKKRVYAKV